jgi:hypothetical protein
MVRTLAEKLMRTDLTVVYYSSNRERPEFEARIMRSLRHASRPLPIISVTQKPVDFGENICVGEREASSQNAWRQLQIGAAAAKTKYVCTAESDFIYPKELFRFVPKSDRCAYIAAPLYVCFTQRGKAKRFYLKPRGSEAAMIVGRKCLVDSIEYILKDVGKWGENQADGKKFPYLLRRIPKRDTIYNRVPTVTFKTDENMHRGTPMIPESKCQELPYLGNVYDLVKKYRG